MSLLLIPSLPSFSPLPPQRAVPLVHASTPFQPPAQREGFVSTFTQISEPAPAGVGDIGPSPEALFLGGAILLGLVVSVVGLSHLLSRRDRSNTPAYGLRIRRVDHFEEMARFLSLRHDDSSVPHRVKIRSFKGMKDEVYRHVMASRGPGIAMTSESFGLRNDPRSAAEIAGYSLRLDTEDLVFEATLPAEAGPSIKKLHLGTARIHHDTRSGRKTIEWLEEAIRKIRRA